MNRPASKTVKQKMDTKVIGLVGGIASGKSTVANAFADLGAQVIQADRLAHDLLDDAAVKSEIRNRWGDSVFDKSGEVDRQALGQVVFADDEARKQLESIIHPRVHTQIVEQLSTARRASAVAVVLDIPLLLEVGWQDSCDEIVFIDASDEVRRQRAAQRGWNAEEWQRRESAQWPVSQKQSAATCSVTSEHSIDAMRDQVTRLWTSWGLPEPNP